MARHVAFLRGVMPTNASMPALRRCFEAAGFEQVMTVRSSGNVVFDTRARSEARIVAQIEAAMARHLDRTFFTLVRSVAHLEALLAGDPFARLGLPAGAKRVVSFLPVPPRAVPRLPVALGDARIVAVDGREVFSCYLPGPNAPDFMKLIEQTFGTDVTTRTWDSVRKCAEA